MAILPKYLFKTLIATIFVVLLVITSLDAIARLIDELGHLSESYDFVAIFYYLLLRVPSSIYEFMPFATLVGALIGLGSLAATSELVAMRSAGVSLLQITCAVMVPVLAFILSALALGEFVIPYSDQQAESHRAIKLGRAQQSASRQGLWSRQGNEFVFIAAIAPGGKLTRVLRYQYDDQDRLLAVSQSEKAFYESTGVWQEQSVVETRFDEGKTQVVTESERSWASDLSPELLDVLVLEPDALAMSNLYQYASYLDKQSVTSDRYWLSFWEKLLQPLAMLSLVLIAISFIFGPLREVTMGFRIFTGVIVGVVFQLSQNLLGPASLVYGFSPFIAVILPIIFCAGIGFYLLMRAR